MFSCFIFDAQTHAICHWKRSTCLSLIEVFLLVTEKGLHEKINLFVTDTGKDLHVCWHSSCLSLDMSLQLSLIKAGLIVCHWKGQSRTSLFVTDNSPPVCHSKRSTSFSLRMVNLSITDKSWFNSLLLEKVSLFVTDNSPPVCHSKRSTSFLFRKVNLSITDKSWFNSLSLEKVSLLSLIRAHLFVIQKGQPVFHSERTIYLLLKVNL